ncbi:mate-domain-containing protein [Haematococcus lacustris]
MADKQRESLLGEQLDCPDTESNPPTEEERPSGWRDELVTMLKLSVPCMVANTSTQIMVITTQIFVGHLGVAQFAAAALANTWFNLLWSFMLGASTAMDSLASQAYGARDYRSLLVWTYAGNIVMTLLCFPIMVALYFARDAAAILFHQGYGEVADLVAEFCHALIPGMWPLAWSLILMKFLQTQNCMVLPAAIIALACLANVGLCAGLVASQGYVGAAWATTLCRAAQAVLLVAGCIWAQGQALKRAGVPWKQWLPVCWAAFKAACHPQVIWAFCKLAMPGGAMNAFEAGAFDITTAFAGALGETATAAHAALLSICVFCFNAMPFAVSIAGSIRVGNLLGSGRPRQARLAGYMCVLLGSGFQAVCGVVIGATEGQVVRIFTSDPETLSMVSSVALLAMAFQFSDGLFGTAQGVMRGMSRQGACVWINALGFWGFGVVLGYLLTFKAGMGLKGLWIGLLAGDFAAMVLSAAVLSRTNWQREADVAQAAAQEAALAQQQNGDLATQLEQQQTEGWVSGVDTSGFEAEALYFIVVPPKPGAPAQEEPQPSTGSAADGWEVISQDGVDVHLQGEASNAPAPVPSDSHAVSVPASLPSSVPQPQPRASLAAFLLSPGMGPDAAGVGVLSASRGSSMVASHARVAAVTSRASIVAAQPGQMQRRATALSRMAGVPQPGVDATDRPQPVQQLSTGKAINLPPGLQPAAATSVELGSEVSAVDQSQPSRGAAGPWMPVNQLPGTQRIPLSLQYQPKNARTSYNMVPEPNISFAMAPVNPLYNRESGTAAQGPRGSRSSIGRASLAAVISRGGVRNPLSVDTRSVFRDKATRTSTIISAIATMFDGEAAQQGLPRSSGLAGPQGSEARRSVATASGWYASARGSTAQLMPARASMMTHGGGRSSIAAVLSRGGRVSLVAGAAATTAAPRPSQPTGTMLPSALMQLPDVPQPTPRTSKGNGATTPGQEQEVAAATEHPPHHHLPTPQQPPYTLPSPAPPALDVWQAHQAYLYSLALAGAALHMPPPPPPAAGAQPAVSGGAAVDATPTPDEARSGTLRVNHPAVHPDVIYEGDEVASPMHPRT